MCAEGAKAPLLFFGATGDDGISFHLGRYGIDHFVARDHMDDLLQLLHQLQARATFRIDLLDFNIDINRCENYRARKFLMLVTEDYNFLTRGYAHVVAQQLRISHAGLCRALRHDSPFPPKRLLLILRHYFAAYLLTVTPWTVKRIAEALHCTDEKMFSKQFKRLAGMTAGEFRFQHHWRDFPAIVLQNIQRNNPESNMVVKIVSKNDTIVKK